MDLLPKHITIKHYKKKELQKAMVEHARDREIGMRYGESFGRRPDILSYPRDILELALQGLTSFHASEERWSNPLSLRSDLSRKELEELRTGWDLVLDIDCSLFEYSRICAELVVRFLKYCGVTEVAVKFSGNKGFHLGVPFEAFPQKVGDKLTKELFPEAAQKITFYIEENIKEALSKKILELENNNFSAIKEKVKLTQEEITRYEQDDLGSNIPKLKVDKFLQIDTVFISSRHLYRMPYSLHEKSGLVSLPIDPSKVLEFEREMARPEKVLRPEFDFLDRKIGQEVSSEGGRRLLTQALDFKVDGHKEREVSKNDYKEIKLESPLREDFFPPCMKLITKGMEDGKKRAVFITSNFLGKIGWSKQEIETYLLKWNREKNQEPLRDNYIKSQLYRFQAGAKLPPNCSNEAYYRGLGICKPDGLCAKIKNPVNYTLIRWRRQLQDKEESDS